MRHQLWKSVFLLSLLLGSHVQQTAALYTRVLEVVIFCYIDECFCDDSSVSLCIGNFAECFAREMFEDNPANAIKCVYDIGVVSLKDYIRNGLHITDEIYADISEAISKCAGHWFKGDKIRKLVRFLKSLYDYYNKKYNHDTKQWHDSDEYNQMLNKIVWSLLPRSLMRYRFVDIGNNMGMLRHRYCVVGSDGIIYCP